MRSLSFLLSRRWILFFLVVIALAWLAWRLGEWQFHRLEDRKASNAIVERNTAGDPVPLDEVMAPGRAVDTEHEWRLVTATGEYDVDDTVVVRYRTRDGQSGVDIVVPLVTTSGTSLLVDRGWMSTGNSGARPDDIPDPPSGEVTVTGWVRKDATGDSTDVSDHSTRAISSSRLAEELGITTYGGFIDLESEDPEAAEPLEQAETPDLSNGPHFFYGLQWWFFGLLAIVGFFWMAYDEWSGKGAKRARQSQGARHPAVDRKKNATQKTRRG
ncbi:SURF1 family cytochrome oxidase biogenesis protein [Nocardioides jensenii]|uniref:SURF1 family cytochrome oxidase biogenesis protein n=1 Tax=Nocardioides jensenii TaxID=1843 RepID=UPI00082FBD3B|nr:SURF1 family protein [Nocardioides jensenii]